MGVTEAVIADLRGREQRGIATYGTTLQPHNGRNARQDRYEELLDAAQYAKQRLLEEPLPAAGASRDVGSGQQSGADGAPSLCYDGSGAGQAGGGNEVRP